MKNNEERVNCFDFVILLLLTKLWKFVALLENIPFDFSYRRNLQDVRGMKMRIFGDVLGIVRVSGGGNPLEVYNSKEMTHETCRGMLN